VIVRRNALLPLPPLGGNCSREQRHEESRPAFLLSGPFLFISMREGDGSVTSTPYSRGPDWVPGILED
jgi:hypothetical protein